MQALLALTAREHPELHARPGGAVLDARVPARSSSSCSGSSSRAAAVRGLTFGWVDRGRLGGVRPAADGVRRARRRDARGRDARGRTDDDEGRRGGLRSSSSRPATARRSSRREAGQRPAHADRGLHRPSQPQLADSVYQAVGTVLGVVNLGGRPPLVVAQPADRPDREPQRRSATSCRACSACRSCRSASSPRSRSSPIARS